MRYVFANSPTLVMGGRARSPHLSGYFFHLRSFVAKAQHNDKMATKVTLPEQIRYDDGVEYAETELAPEKGKLGFLNESSRKE